MGDIEFVEAEVRENEFNQNFTRFALKTLILSLKEYHPYA